MVSLSTLFFSDRYKDDISSFDQFICLIRFCGVHTIGERHLRSDEMQTRVDKAKPGDRF